MTQQASETWTTADGTKDWLHGYSGDPVHCLDLRDEEITIENIAAGLRKPRFNGFTDRYYSIAEHSVRGSWMLPDYKALYFLLHDAAEAFTSDIPTPFKAHPVYSGLADIEHGNQMKILAHFGLDPFLPDFVHEVDQRMLATEKRDLMRPGKARWTVNAQPYTDRIYPMLPDEAMGQFLLRFKQLTGTLLGNGREPNARFARGGRA